MPADDGLEPLPPSLARTWGDTTTWRPGESSWVPPMGHAQDCGLLGDAECTCHKREESRRSRINEERCEKMRKMVYTVEICPDCLRQEPHPHGKYRWQCQCGRLLFVDADEAAAKPHYRQTERIRVVVDVR